jgi:NitT/TauT family transport system ATP-binding protein
VSFSLRSVTKAFADEPARAILSGINLKVEDSEFLCLMGPSGCGKSTLLRIMAGLIPPTSGQVVNRPPRIGFVFQNFALFPWLTVEENIGYGLKMHGEKSTDITRIVTQKLHQMGLAGLGKRHPRELSGGQKQRVGIARALAIDPDVLMLDEPFSALDAFTATELRDDLLKVWQASHRPVVMVTHLPEEAAQLADRVIVLSARPGAVSAEITNHLPRPRQKRSPEFFRLVDRLEDLIRPSRR